jgi:thiamine-phosphate pyrophosphorylase
MQHFADPLLYAILDLGYVDKTNAEEVTGALLAGGADVLQLRAKGYSLEMVRELASRLKPLCRTAAVPFVLNDHLELAAELDTDGLHIGQDDGTLAEARKLLGPDKIIGRSTHSLEQATVALAEGFDYIGFGPLFPTPTKVGRPGIGTQDIARMERDVGSQIPAFCIGGVKLSNLAEVIARGARRVAIVSDLLTAGDVEIATRRAKDMLRVSGPHCLGG